MHNFANEGHGAVTESAQGIQGDGAERVTGVVVVAGALLQLTWLRLRAVLPAYWAEQCRLLGATPFHSDTPGTRPPWLYRRPICAKLAVTQL
jgi:hypothetical protein